MKLILIQGFNQYQKIWIDNIFKHFDLYFDDIILFEHKKNMSKVINNNDINNEAKELTKIINNCNDNYAIFAQTTGIFVTLKAIKNIKKKPFKCVFLDIPIIRARINNIPIDILLKNHNINTLFIQNKIDPDFLLHELYAYLKKLKIKNFKLIELNTIPENSNDVKIFNHLFSNYMFYLNSIIRNL